VMSPIILMVMVVGGNPAEAWSSCTGKTTNLPDSVTEASGAPAATGKSTLREVRVPYSGPVLLTINGSREVQIAAESGVARVSLVSLQQQAGVEVSEVSASAPNSLTPRSLHASISQLQAAAADLQQRHLEYLQQRQLDRPKAAMCFDRCTAGTQESHNSCDQLSDSNGSKGDCYTTVSEGFRECIDDCKSTTGFDIYMGNPGGDLRPDPYMIN